MFLGIACKIYYCFRNLNEVVDKVTYNLYFFHLHHSLITMVCFIVPDSNQKKEGQHLGANIISMGHNGGILVSSNSVCAFIHFFINKNVLSQQNHVELFTFFLGHILYLDLLWLSFVSRHVHQDL